MWILQVGWTSCLERLRLLMCTRGLFFIGTATRNICVWTTQVSVTNVILKKKESERELFSLSSSSPLQFYDDCLVFFFYLVFFFLNFSYSFESPNGSTNTTWDDKAPWQRREKKTALFKQFILYFYYLTHSSPAVRALHGNAVAASFQDRRRPRRFASLSPYRSLHVWRFVNLLVYVIHFVGFSYLDKRYIGVSCWIMKGTRARDLLFQPEPIAASA